MSQTALLSSPLVFARRRLASRTVSALLAVSAVVGLQVPAHHAVAAPAAQRDVEIAAGEDVVGWVSLQSLNAVVQAAQTVAGRAKLLPPDADPDKMLRGAVEGLATQFGLQGTAWLAFDAPIHVFFQDRNITVDSAPQALMGLVVAIPVVSKAALLQAAAGSPNKVEPQGHDLAIDMGTGMPVYIDIIGNHAVLTMDPTRFAQVQTFVKKLQGIDVPGLFYAGVSIEDLSRTRAPMIEAALAELEQEAQKATGNDDDKSTAALAKTMRQWLMESARFEFIFRADAKAFGLEGRITAKSGTELSRTLDATRGKVASPMAALLPANSYFAAASSSDPSGYKERMDDSMALIKTLLKLSDAQVTEATAAMSELAGLNDGTAAMGMYADKGAAFAGLLAIGTTDGAKAWQASRKVASKMAGWALDAAVAAGNAPPPAVVDLMRKSIEQASPAPLVAEYGPMMAEKGVHVMLQSTADGGAACESLMVRFDFSKSGNASDEKKIKPLFGMQTGATACTGPKRLAFAFGPSSVDKAKAASTGKAGGFVGTAAWKAVSSSASAAAVLMFLHPSWALAAWKDVIPESDLPKGLKLPDRGVLATCQNRTRSFGCGFEISTDLIVAGILAAKGG